MMDLNSKLTLNLEAIARPVGDETVILHLGSGTYFGLDPVGTRIWQLMGEGLPLSAICDTLVIEYGQSREVIERDLLKLLGYLLDHKLVALDALDS
jgi:hypothetical protein